jgi:hypothetical protein
VFESPVKKFSWQGFAFFILPGRIKEVYSFNKDPLKLRRPIILNALALAVVGCDLCTQAIQWNKQKKT